MRTAVLAGGGARGSYQAGALTYLLTQYDYEIVTGVSVGAINAAYIAQFPLTRSSAAADGLMNLWFQMSPERVLRQWYNGYLSYVPTLWKPSVYDTTPLHRFLRDHLDPSRIRSSGRRLQVGAVSMDTGAYGSWCERDADVVDGVLASSAFPAFMTPVRARGQWWIDGGVHGITAIEDSIRMGATEVDVICCNPGVRCRDKRRQRPTVAEAINTAFDAVDAWDLKIAESAYAPVKVRVLRPDHELLENALDFNAHKIKVNFDKGFAAAQVWDREN